MNNLILLDVLAYSALILLTIAVVFLILKFFLNHDDQEEIKAEHINELDDTFLKVTQRFYNDMKELEDSFK